jgi:hypothetical protein
MIDADPNRPLSQWANRPGKPEKLTVIVSIFLFRKNLQESDGEMPLFPYIVRHVGRKNPINIGFLLGDRVRTSPAKSPRGTPKTGQ